MTDRTDDVEVELKLLASAEGLQRLATDPTLKAQGLSAAEHLELVATYFDTPDLRLSRRGVVLRVREGGGRFIQTLKTAAMPESAITVRGEWECEVAGPHPELDKITDLVAREKLGLVLAEELAPVFTTRFTRKTCLIAWPNGAKNAARIELALDQGSIDGPAGSLPIGEVELELKSGEVRDLMGLAGHLRGLVPLRLGIDDKAARGFRLSAGIAPGAQRALKPGLSREMTSERALEAILTACLKHWTMNEAVVMDGRDSEGVHQMRVALRRARSALALFKSAIDEEVSETWNERLRWLIRELGPAREVDVFASELLAPVTEALGEEPALEALQVAAEHERERAYDALRNLLSEQRYADLVLDFAAFVVERGWRRTSQPERLRLLERPLEERAVALLNKRHKRVRKRGKKFEELDAQDRHRLRLAIKKLRYGTEFLRDLFDGKPARRFAKALARMQDVLGHANDIAESRRMVERLAAATRNVKERRLVERGGGIVIGWHAARTEGLEAGAVAEWGAFRALEPYWRT